jgi:Spy/CpxP family protein refolding chaperone
MQTMRSQIMKALNTIFFAGALALCPAAVTAAPQASADAGSGKRTKLHCRSIPKSTGYMREKVCQTKEQWAQEGVTIRENKADRRRRG